MPIGSQPRRARGTVGHAYSALNLRLLLAAFGLIVCTGLAVVTALAGRWVLTLLLSLLAGAALVDIVVIVLRIRARRRAEGGGHSLFE